MVLLGKLLPAGSGRAGSGQVVSRICSRYQQKHATRATTTTTTTTTTATTTTTNTTTKINCYYYEYRSGGGVLTLGSDGGESGPPSGSSLRSRTLKKGSSIGRIWLATWCFINMLQNRAYMTPEC